MQYATDRQAAVQQQRGLSSLSCTFVHGSCFDPTVMAALGRFDRIHVGGSCPKPRLRDLLKLLKPGERLRRAYTVHAQSAVHLACGQCWPD